MTQRWRVPHPGAWLPFYIGAGVWPGRLQTYALPLPGAPIADSWDVSQSVPGPTGPQKRPKTLRPNTAFLLWLQSTKVSVTAHASQSTQLIRHRPCSSQQCKLCNAGLAGSTVRTALSPHQYAERGRRIRS